MTVKEWIKCVVRGERASQALVIVGARGSGKGVAVRALETLLTGRQIETIDVFRIANGDAWNTLGRAATERDIVVADDVHTYPQLDAVKALISADNIELDVKAVGKETRTIKASLIVTTDFFPYVSNDRRFIEVSPITFIAELLPFLAR